jgi:hypothetical protein
MIRTAMHYTILAALVVLIVVLWVPALTDNPLYN